MALIKRPTITPAVFPTAFPEVEAVPESGQKLEELHGKFMGQWLQALSALVPAQVKVQPDRVEFLTYEAYVRRTAAIADIQVFEVDALQSLFAWTLDPRLIPVVVDCMFGGGARIPLRDMNRQLTPIEMAVRQRVLESLSTAYEAAWQPTYPFRMKPLRSETEVASLRLAALQDSVVHAKFKVQINKQSLGVELCMPKRALDSMLNPAGAPREVTPAGRGAWSRSLRHKLQVAPVEAVVVLTEKEISIAQLLSLSIGQAIPIDLSMPVRLLVDGTPLLSGRYGVRHGRNAVKVESLNLEHSARERAPMPGASEDFESPAPFERTGTPVNPSIIAAETAGSAVQAEPETMFNPRPDAPAANPQAKDAS